MRAGGEVGAEEEGIAGLELAAEVLEDGAGFRGGEVADAGADVEGEDAGVVGTSEVDWFGNVIGDLGTNGEIGDRSFECFGFGEAGGAYVDGLVEEAGLGASGGAEEDAGLGGGACAKLGDGDGAGKKREDFSGVRGEDGALGAGEVVLGEGGDLLEELGAGLVVEEPGGEDFGIGGEASAGFGGYSLGEGYGFCYRHSVVPLDERSPTFLDLGAYQKPGVHSADLDQPATGPGFDEKALVSSLGDGVTRGDGPNPRLAPLHAQSQRLADLLNRLSLNEPGTAAPFTATLAGHSVATPPDLIAALLTGGHTLELTDSRYFANFGHLHYHGADVMMPFWVNTEIRIPNTRKPLLVPVSHAEYEWQIRGPQVNAAVAFYFGIDGKAEFRTMDQLDQPWVMKRNAHTYTGADAIEVTRLSAAIVRAYMRLHAAHPALPFGGYYALGVCQDVIAAIELKLTGHATLYPNTANDSYFTNAQDAEINTLIRRLPKDRAGRLPDVSRIFASLPVGSSDAELATVTIPDLGQQLIAVHDAWTDGTLSRTRPHWRRWALIALGAVLLLAAGIWLMRRR